MAKLETLVGPNLRLTPFKEEHICERYLGWLNDPEVNRFLEVQFVPQTHETALAYVSSFYGEAEKYMWGVYLKSNNDLIGTATLSDINRNHRRGALGLMIGEKKYWGQGYAKEIINLVVGYAFKRLGLHKVVAGAVAANQGSIKAFQKAGFEIEGKLKSHFCLDGKYYDSLYLGITRDDFSGNSGG
jgi:ribosomal-protein-alanine N-acetyltransferase